MYPEEGGAAPEPVDYGPPSGGFKSRLSRNLEGLIPLILIIVIIALVGAKFGFWNIPFLSGYGEPKDMLLIGEASPLLEQQFNMNSNLVRVHKRSPHRLRLNPEEQLAEFDLVMLNQSTLADKSVSGQLADALSNYVKWGGKLIVVMDSGIRIEGASDVLGWEGVFEGSVPVKCENTANPIAPGCTDKRNVQGIIYRDDYKHPIMEGIERAPAAGLRPYFLETFPITPVGKQVAFIEDTLTGETYPAIVEKTLIGGKSIYFNYDPGLTPEIFRKTLKYLT